MSAKKTDVAEIAYFLYFAVMFGARAIGLYEGMLLYNITLVIGMLLFAVKVALTEHTVMEYALMGSLLLLSLLVYYNTGEKGLLLYLTMMLGLKGVPVKKVFALGAAILSTAFVTLVLLTVTGLKGDITYLHDRAPFGQVIRHSLGYPYPNTLFTTYIVLMVLLFHVLGKQSKRNLLLTTLLLFMGTIYIYLYSCSNTGLIVGVFYLLVHLYLELRQKLTRIEKTAFMLVYPVCLLISIAGPLLTGGRLFQLFDRVLHNRWAYSLYYLTHEPVTLLGVRFKAAPNDNYMIDSSFLYSFLQLGIIPFVILTGLFICMICDYVEREKKAETAMIVGFCVLGLSDPFLFNLSYKNLMFLLAGEFLYRKLAAWEEKAPLWLKNPVRLLPAGNREVRGEFPFGENLKKAGLFIRETISKNSIRLTVLYLATAFGITVCLYFALQAGYITGRIDRSEEWEFVRNVVSGGVFGAVIITAGFLGRLIQKNGRIKA